MCIRLHQDRSREPRAPPETLRAPRKNLAWSRIHLLLEKEPVIPLGDWLLKCWRDCGQEPVTETVHSPQVSLPQPMETTR